MKILIRAAFMILSVTVGMPQVANAAFADNAPAPTQQQDTMAGWANG